jgi:hypothetical protein
MAPDFGVVEQLPLELDQSQDHLTKTGGATHFA